MASTVDSTRLAIVARNQEIDRLLAQPVVDRLAVEELMSANQRDLRILATAQNLINAAPRRIATAFIPRAFAH